MAARERGVDEIAGPRMTRMHGHVGAALVDLDDAAHVGEVELRIDALRVEIHGHRDDVHVARALAVAEQRALDAVGAREQAELAGRDGAAAIVVRVQAHADVLALYHVAAEILDLIGEHVRVVISTVAGRLITTFWPCCGCQTSMTALQTSTA